MIENIDYKESNFFHVSYLYAFELSGLTEEEFELETNKDECILPFITLTDHQEFYDTYKDSIHSLLTDIDNGKYEFLKDSYYEFIRNIWVEVIMENLDKKPIETVIDDVVDFILVSIIKIIKEREEYQFFF